MTVVLFYHELADGDSPLCVPPDLFSEHLRVLADCGANVLTAAELAAELDRGPLEPRTVVLTFDDGFSAAVHEARPRLDAAAMRATFYCVAGHLGGSSDWPSRLPGAPVGPLASAAELRALAGDGHEIGAHGWSHAPLDGPCDLERELVDARDALEEAVGTTVRTLAYPYGALPTSAARALAERTYEAGFTTRIGSLDASSPHWSLPRVDAHYVRDPRLLRRLVTGKLTLYLSARRIGSRTRRALHKDYVTQRAA